MKADYIALGENIRKHRKLAGLTQAKLAAIVDCSDRHIGQIEKGKNIPSYATVIAIANALNIGIDQLAYRDLENCTDYYIQELVSLTKDFGPKEKLMSIEMVKSIVKVMKDFKME